MVISYAGGQCFKVSQGDLTLSFNPPARDSKLASAKFGADIALISLDHADFNGVENAASGARQPFVIGGPSTGSGQGDGVLGHAAAYKLAVQLEPKVIVPMHYDEKSLKAFLKEAGAEGTKAEEKLTIKKKDLEGKEAEVVVLSA